MENSGRPSQPADPGLAAAVLESHSDEAIVRIEGVLDALTTMDLIGSLESLAAAPPRTVILDLSQLRLIDAVGIRAIGRLLHRLRAHGSHLRAVGLRGQPRTAMTLVRLDQVFDQQL